MFVHYSSYYHNYSADDPGMDEESVAPREGQLSIYKKYKRSGQNKHGRGDRGKYKYGRGSAKFSIRPPSSKSQMGQPLTPALVVGNKKSGAL